ncbi:MAG: hypothetical protein PsegKO_35750 [Pseudohongiellaceae bacterium]
MRLNEDYHGGTLKLLGLALQLIHDQLMAKMHAIELANGRHAVLLQLEKPFRVVKDDHDDGGPRIKARDYTRFRLAVQATGAGRQNPLQEAECGASGFVPAGILSAGGWPGLRRTSRIRIAQLGQTTAQ